MSTDRSILETPAVKKLKTRLNALLDEYLLHDGWGHLEMDMRILARHQKEVVIRAGREYRFVVDFQNVAAREDTHPSTTESGGRPSPAAAATMQSKPVAP